MVNDLDNYVRNIFLIYGLLVIIIILTIMIMMMFGKIIGLVMGLVLIGIYLIIGWKIINGMP